MSLKEKEEDDTERKKERKKDEEEEEGVWVLAERLWEGGINTPKQ